MRLQTGPYLDTDLPSLCGQLEDEVLAIINNQQNCSDCQAGKLSTNNSSIEARKGEERKERQEEEVCAAPPPARLCIYLLLNSNWDCRVIG